MPTKLLVADDDPAVRSAVADVVADDFDVVLEANNGLEVLDVVRQEQPDVVLLDLEMPGLNGIDTCRQLRSLPQVRNTPILMLTVHNAAGKVRAAFDAGASDYIFKPFQIGQLRARLRTWALRGDVIA